MLNALANQDISSPTVEYLGKGRVVDRGIEDVMIPKGGERLHN